MDSAPSYLPVAEMVFNALKCIRGLGVFSLLWLYDFQEYCTVQFSLEFQAAEKPTLTPSLGRYISGEKNAHVDEI